MNARDHSPSVLDIQLIKKLRKHFGMTQPDLASQSGLSYSTIVCIETSRLTNPHLTTLNALAKAFNINAAQLLYTEVPEPVNFEIAQRLAKREHENLFSFS